MQGGQRRTCIWSPSKVDASEWSGTGRLWPAHKKLHFLFISFNLLLIPYNLSKEVPRNGFFSLICLICELHHRKNATRTLKTPKSLKGIQRLRKMDGPLSLLKSQWVYFCIWCASITKRYCSLCFLFCISIKNSSGRKKFSLYDVISLIYNEKKVDKSDKNSQNILAPTCSIFSYYERWR